MTLPLPPVINEALCRGVYRDESLQDAPVEVEVLTAGEGVVPVAATLPKVCSGELDLGGKKKVNVMVGVRRYNVGEEVVRHTTRAPPLYLYGFLLSARS